MRVQDVQQILENWAPKDIAWERDNVGLQVGNPAAQVRGILVSLDVTEHVAAEARQRGTNLLICHHPLLFRPVRVVNTNNEGGRILQYLLRWRIACYAAHTNLDFAQGGTSFALGKALGMHSVDFLEQQCRIFQKVVTFVPSEHTDAVTRAMAEAGAGQIGNYTECSFRTNGAGTFRGNTRSSPAVGTRGRREEVPEVRVEMVASRRDVPTIIRAMKAAHPYEEVAYDVYPLENISNNYGMGAIGTLKRPVTLKTFLTRAKRALRLPAIRYTGRLNQKVRRIAVCGGSGSDLVETAIARGADVFVTADVKYHDFHDARGRIILVDAGHFETEIPVVETIVSRIKSELRTRNLSVPVLAARTTTNPIAYF